MFCPIVMITCDGIFVFSIILHCRQHKKEQIRNVKACANGSNNKKHAWLFGHGIDFNHSRVIDKGSLRLEKLWRLGIPCMPTITLCRSLISIAFFSNSSHPFHTFTFLSFLSNLFCIYFTNLHFMFYPWKAVDRQPKSCFFKTFSQRTFLLCFNMYHPGRASIFNCIHRETRSCHQNTDRPVHPD